MDEFSERKVVHTIIYMEIAKFKNEISFIYLLILYHIVFMNA
jgi:hypothetical protein